jgi:hypothetical protein
VCGLPRDAPMPGDYDGDGRADIVVFRPATGMWYMLRSSVEYSMAVWVGYQWGLPGDVAISGGG